MKKVLLVILPLLIVASGIVFAVPKNGGLMNNSNKKILITYFSWGG